MGWRPGCTWSGTSCWTRPGTGRAPRSWPPGYTESGRSPRWRSPAGWPGQAGSPPPARRSGSPGRGITVSSSDRKGPPGKLSRQGPPVLRWAVCEAGKAHARTSAPDHAYYAQVKDRKNSKRAALSEARKIIRQACHILAELGDDALAAALTAR